MVNKRYSLKIVNLYLFEILQVTFIDNISTKTKYIIKYSSIFKNQFSHKTIWQLIRPTAIDFAQCTYLKFYSQRFHVDEILDISLTLSVPTFKCLREKDWFRKMQIQGIPK